MSADPVVLFAENAGKVLAIDSAVLPVILFSVDGNTRTFNNLKAIVTSIGIQGQGGFQFMHALREYIYVYVFTERVGEIVINGLAFPEVCEPIGPQEDQNWCVYGKTGLERVITWYECNRITTRAEPIVIALGADVAYEAFLTGMKTDITNPETGIAQFTMHFNYIPNISDEDDYCFSASDSCLPNPCAPSVTSTSRKKKAPSAVYGWENVND